MWVARPADNAEREARTYNFEPLPSNLLSATVMKARALYGAQQTSAFAQQSELEDIPFVSIKDLMLKHRRLQLA